MKNHRFATLVNFLTLVALIVGQTAAQEPDVASLVHPDVAERLSLVDSQRAEVQSLLQARAEALATSGNEAAKDKLKTDFATKILAVLNDQQRAKFKEVKAAKKLMFQFREMKWDNVLDWFAGQQDLTLVMDQIPPGTFTYSDSRSYSPSEGIDLLNSVLMTRNFTLVRREKMLVVMALSDSIPLELLPRVTLQNLVQRGRFELVSVLFPLGGRPTDVVLQEIKPFLSGYGRVVPLARGSQVLVVETAGKMQTINEIIASIPLPKDAPKPETPLPPPKPVFASYSLGTLDATRALETIRKLIPSDHITVDSKTGVMSAFLIPDQQTAIKLALDQMIASATQLPTLESVAYPLSGATADEIKKQIQSLAPNATVTAAADRILVIARAEDQHRIKTSLAALDIVPIEGSKGMKVFELEPSVAPAVEAALKSFLPKGQIASSKSGSFIVRGSEDDLRIANEMIEIFKRTQTASQLQLRIFPLEQKADAKWLATLQKILPNTNAWLGDDGRQLMILAAKTDITVVESILPQLMSLLPQPDQRKMQFYLLTKNQLSRRGSLTDLPSNLLGIKIVDGINKQELMVWATSEQHVAFAKLLEGLDQQAPAPTPTSPKTYPITVQDSALVLQILIAEFPEAKITVDADGSTLTVLADDASHAKLATRVATFNEQLPKKNVLTLEPYSVRGMSVTALQQSLAPLLLKARVNVDTVRNRLLVATDAKTHLEISALVNSLSEKPGVEQQQIVVAYPVENAVATQVKIVFDQLALGATSIADDKLKQIVVTGTLETHAIAKAMITQIDRPALAGSPKEIRSYDAKKLQAAALLPTLQKLWPELQLSADTTSNRIIASGSVKELNQLDAAVERLISSPDGKPQFVKTYPVPAGDMLTLASILGQIAPQAIVSSDILSRTVTVWAGEDQQTRVQQALEQISKTAQAAKEASTYSVKPTQVAAVQASLQSLFPGIGIASVPTTGQLIVVASPEQQTRIAEVIELMASGPNASERTVKVFRVDPERVELASLLNALQSTLPSQIRLESNPANNTILAIGTPEELDLATTKVDELQKQMPAPEGLTSKVYPLKYATTSGAVAILQPLVPKAVFVRDASTKTLAATAKASDHQKIQEFLKAYDVQTVLATYLVKPTQTAMVQSSLKSLFPLLEITSDPTSGQLIVMASPDQQKRVAEVIEMVANGPNALERAVKVFVVDPERAEITSLLNALKSTLPTQIRVESNLTNNTMLAIGTSEELELVARKVDELQKQLPAPEALISTVYPLRYATTSGAIAVLQPMVPRAVFVRDALTKTLAATAKASDHRKIEEFLKAYDVQTVPATYVVKPTQTTMVQSSLKSLFPLLEITSDPTTGQLIVIASPDQQKRVSEVVDLIVSGPNSSERTVKVFKMDPDRVDPTSFVSALQSTLPSTIRLESSSRNGSILAIGTPEELTMVADKFAKLQQELPPPDASSSVVYPLKYGNTVSALAVLQALAPRATIVQDVASRTIAATARAHEHQRIREFLQTFDQPKISNRETHVYRLKYASARGLSTILIDLMPDAVIYGSREEGVLIATATPEQHKRIEGIVKDFDVETQNNVTRVFPVKKGTAASLRAALQGFSSKATATADAATNSLIVTAPSSEIERIAQIVMEVDAGGIISKGTRFYSLTSSEPLPLSRALQESFPKASFAPDTASGGVFAAATEEDHVSIAKVVAEINSQPSKLPSLRAFVLKHAKAESVADALQTAFGRRSTAGVSFSRDAKSVFVVGSRQELLVAEQLVEQFDSAKPAGESKRLQLFSLGGVDGKAVTTSIESLFKDDGRSVDVRYDAINEQLFVTGTPTQLQLVEDAIKQFAPPPRELEIIQLNSADPMSFKLAADALFQDEPLTSAPMISIDANQQQVLVRATKNQLESVHKLLKQMGESQEPSKVSNGTGRLRFVPIHRGSKQLLEDIKQVWPSMRNNPINIVNPQPTGQLAPEPTALAAGSGKNDPSKSEPNPFDSPNISTSRQNAATTQRLTSTQANANAQLAQKELSPIIVVTGEDQWTLASDDTEALDLFTRLLDTLMNPKVTPFATAGNFSVYILRHADAKHLREMLLDLFGSGESSRRSSFSDAIQRVKIVADSRINALIIGGNRADRKIVEELLSVFDSEDLLDTLQQIAPTVFQLQAASAKNVASILQDVYKSQLTSGAGREPVPIPEGVSDEVATVLQQINAQQTGPLLTVSVDDSTNSIVLRGPPSLTSEVRTFIEKLDQQSSTSSARRVQVLRLESTNTKNLEKALNLLRSK